MTLKMQQPFNVDENKRWFKKWWPKGVPFNTKFEEKTINELLDEQVDKYQDEKFIWFLDAWITYKQFQGYVKSFATALANLGIKKGDVIAIYLPNCPQYIVAYYAITRIGAIASGINPTYQPVEVLHQSDITKPKMLIVLDALYESSIKPIIQEIKIETVVYTNITDLVEIKGIKKAIGKFVKKIPTGKVDFPGALKYKELLKTRPEVPEVTFDIKKHPVFSEGQNAVHDIRRRLLTEKMEEEKDKKEKERLKKIIANMLEEEIENETYKSRKIRLKEEYKKLTGKDFKEVLKRAGLGDDEICDDHINNLINNGIIYEPRRGVYRCLENQLIQAKDKKINGQIANAVFQVTSDPPTVAVSINKKNLTHEYITVSKAIYSGIY